MTCGTSPLIPAPLRAGEFWHPFRQVTAVALLAVMTSCTLSHRHGVAEVKRARKDLEAIEVKNTYVQGAVLGVAVGAAAGAIIGATKGDGRGAAQGALIGGLSGSVAGLTYADSVVKRRREYAKMEMELEMRIRKMRSKKVSAVKFNQVLKAQLVAAENDLKAREAMVAEANKVVDSLNRDLVRQENVVATARAGRMSLLKRRTLEMEVERVRKERDAVQQLVASATAPMEGADQARAAVSLSAAPSSAGDDSSSAVGSSASSTGALGAGR